MDRTSEMKTILEKRINSEAKLSSRARMLGMGLMFASVLPLAFLVACMFWIVQQEYSYTMNAWAVVGCIAACLAACLAIWNIGGNSVKVSRLRANKHLLRLRDRYRLRSERHPESGLPTLDFVVEDLERQGATRSLKTLSGGESFLVSLALALGLSDLRTSSMPVETLMLDEGFGTLDPQTLETALDALGRLKGLGSGRQVGIISHVQGLQERIDARILVEPQGEGRSRVRAGIGLE